MKLNDINFVKLLPKFMQDDDFNIGLANGIDDFIGKLKATFDTFSVWDRIDELTEEELDKLAWELNIEWYRQAASIEVKRQLIKDSSFTHSKRGTKWAVEKVINTYFGDGYIQEWFEYEGEPGHFKVFSSNPTITDEKLQEFLEILNKVKRASSHLDGITISLTGQMKLHTGVGYKETSFETIRLGKRI